MERSPFERLQLVRRIDWRFLLPTPPIGAVVCVGRPDAELVEALRGFGTSLVVPTEESAAPAEVCDLAVAVNPTRPELRAAVGLLRPGGSLYVELRGWVAPRRRFGSWSLGPVEDALAELGFEEVRLHWHFPDLRACEEIVPLAEAETIRYALGRRRSAAVARVKTAVARALLAAGGFSAVVPSRSVTARLAVRR